MQEDSTLHFPDLGEVTIDQERAETFGLMTVSQDGVRKCFRFKHIVFLPVQEHCKIFHLNKMILKFWRIHI